MISKKEIFTLTLVCIAELSHAQTDKPYTKSFESGTITRIDGTDLSGLLSFYLSHGGKVKFKATEQAEEEKYAPDEVKKFQIGNDYFETLDSLTVFGQMGVRTKLRNCFGQILERGKISVYLIYFIAPDPFGGGNIYYLNLWLIKTLYDRSVGFAVPYNQQLKAGKIQKIKNELKSFIHDTQLDERIDNMTRESGMAETVEIVKQYNSRTN